MIDDLHLYSIVSYNLNILDDYSHILTVVGFNLGDELSDKLKDYKLLG